MSWFKKMTGGLAGKSGANLQWTVAGISFDTTGWTLDGASQEMMSWTAPHATLKLTRADRSGDPQQPSLGDLRRTQRAALRAAGEDLVLFEIVDLKEGTALQCISKRRDGTGYAYRGLIECHCEGTLYRIASDMTEVDTTGVREAMVSAARVQCGEFALGPQNADGSFRILGFSFDPYDPAFDEDAENSVADDEQLDAVLPGHPLSRTRALHQRIAATLRTDRGAVLTATAASHQDSTPLPRLRRQLSPRVARVLLAMADRHDLVEQSLQAEIASLDGSSDEGLAACLLELGVFLQMQGRPEDAVPVLSRAERMLTVIEGEDGMRTVVARAHHGYALFRMQRPAEALPLLMRSIAVLEQREPDGMTYAVALNGATQILAGQSDDRAAHYLERLREVMAKIEQSSQPPRRPH